MKLISKVVSRLIPNSVKNNIESIVIDHADRFLAKKVWAQDKKIADLDTEIGQIVSLLGLKGIYIAIPPSHLQIRVSGAYYKEFFNHGLKMLRDIEKLFSYDGKTINSFNKILDFACGCGRFMIPMRQIISPAKLYGSDIDQEAINWLNSYYPEFAGVIVNPHMPPMNFPDNFFDLIIGVSVFTHIPEDMQNAWLKELHRILQPGGFAVLSTHGGNCLSSLKKDELDIYYQKGFYYSKNENVTTEGLPVFYQTSYHTIDYIDKYWSEYFEIVEHRPAGLDNFQDLHLLRKKV
jgi:ubiquinone/menaquinone biosynthesis C-methylase UbiE